MSDQELQQLSSSGYGGDVGDPFSGSTIESKKKKKKTKELDIEEEYDDPTRDPNIIIREEFHDDELDIEDELEENE